MNIYNQNVAFNYRGILNLDATTINTPLDATLRAVTDGMGTSSLLNLSTEQVGVLRTVNLAAGATTPRLFNVAYTINNSGAQTGTLTGLFLNATETALNGITHNLMDLQVGGVSRMKFERITANQNQLTLSNVSGAVQSGWTAGDNSGNSGYIGTLTNHNFSISTNNNYKLLITTAASTFVALGSALTSSFPAIKRNGAAIDFRLADDSAYCNIKAQYGIFDVVYNTTFSIGFAGGTAGIHLNSVGSTIFSATGATSINASAQLQIDSTTKGFLMPRMTQAQILAIATPANGLMVYNTDLACPCFYDGTGWRKVSHSAM
jgi:hypothetical protein